MKRKRTLRCEYQFLYDYNTDKVGFVLVSDVMDFCDSCHNLIMIFDLFSAGWPVWGQIWQFMFEYIQRIPF